MRPRTFSEQDIHLSLDNELPLDDQPGFEVWLEAHPDMKALSLRYAEDKASLQEAFKDVMQEPVPPAMMEMLASSHQDNRAGNSLWKFAAIAASLLLVGGLGGYLTSQVSQAPVQVADGARQIIDGAINAHLIFASEKTHVVDVGANDVQGLNSWLSDRVGMKLVAPDLKTQGFELVGGRLLPQGETAAAQFMYQDAEGNRLSLYITRYNAKAVKGYQLVEERGAKSLYWQEDGFGCSITGSLPKERLTEIAKAAYKQFMKSSAT